MSCPYSQLSRRGILAAAGGLLAAAPVARAVAEAPPIADTVPFWGSHQAGIVTPQQGHTCFAAFDLHARKASEVVALLRTWTQAASRMAAGETAAPLADDPGQPPADSFDAEGLPASRLTITFGFGPGLFASDGADRYGLASRRPDALVDLPRFNGDQLVPARTGGDISVQACADDPQVAFHAIRQLGRLAYGAAELRWIQTGYASRRGTATPRNLMGFKDGTQIPAPLDPVVWADAPGWMAGGSYLVARRIRIALEHWDRTPLDFQEEVVGRHKRSGAPLGKTDEFAALDLDRVDETGNPVIGEGAHVRLANAASNDGAQMLRRGFSYNDGANITAERWPPWRQGMEFDAGLFFIAYQRDPRTGFIRIFENMAKFDLMNQFATHVGSGVFAVPGGIAPGSFAGQGLFDAA